MTRPSEIEIWPMPFDREAELDWADPQTSKRLLAEHLDARHDSASRRPSQVTRHLRRLQRLLPAAPARIIDAACGPGLYATPLADAGYDVRGFDVGPAVVAHAKKAAADAGVGERCTFTQDSLATVVLEPDHDAALLIYHVLESFPRRDQAQILHRLRDGLRVGAPLIVELRLHPDHPDGRLSSWEVADWSLLSERRHLLLSDSTYDATTRTFVLRETAIFDDGTMAVQQTTSQLIALARIPTLFRRGGFDIHALYDGWSTRRADATSETVLVVARAR